MATMFDLQVPLFFFTCALLFWSQYSASPVLGHDRAPHFLAALLLLQLAVLLQLNLHGGSLDQLCQMALALFLGRLGATQLSMATMPAPRRA